MELNDFKVSKSLKKSIKKFTYKFNTNFQQVMKECASKTRKDQNGTWILNETIEAYTMLHGMDIAHSIEAYQDDILVGGLYGLQIGKVFCGESMFANKTDASKSAYAILIRHLKEWGYDFIDCQVPTEHLKSLGAREVDREYFLQRLEISNMRFLNHKWEINTELIK
jgi:leucyl/phenylalanyl-tRNA--protein transferase